MARTSQFPPSVDPGSPITPPTPTGWAAKSFRELVETVERPVQLEPDVTYQLVNAKRSRGGIVPRAKLLGRDILVKSQFRVHAGDFLMSLRQIIHGACGIVPPKLDGAVVSNEYLVLRPKPGLLVEYLQCMSHTPYFQRTCFHSSVGVDVEKMIFKVDRWLGFQVPVPPLEVQSEIVASLAAVTEVEFAACSARDRAVVLKRAVMSELLTRGIPGRVRGRTPLSSEWRIGRIAPSITEIPEHWELVRLTDVARLESGHTPSRRRPDYWNGGIPWVSLHDSDRLDVPEIRSTSQTISSLGVANSSARLLPAGTVVFSRTATVGKSTVLATEMTTSQDFANFVCGSRIHNKYLMQVFRHMQPEWRRLMAGSTHQTIYMPVFESLQVLLPPLDEQETIAAIGEALDKRIAAEEDLLAQLPNLEKALRGDLFKGAARLGGAAL
jgi:type I restriction enzyme S subunit